jgi:hypothetical protein
MNVCGVRLRIVRRALLCMLTAKTQWRKGTQRKYNKDAKILLE